jgi:hypothetical protein
MQWRYPGADKKYTLVGILVVLVRVATNSALRTSRDQTGGSTSYQAVNGKKRRARNRFTIALVRVSTNSAPRTLGKLN